MSASIPSKTIILLIICLLYSSKALQLTPNHLYSNLSNTPRVINSPSMEQLSHCLSTCLKLKADFPYVFRVKIGVCSSIVLYIGRNLDLSNISRGSARFKTKTGPRLKTCLVWRRISPRGRKTRPQTQQ